ncbi:MAG: VapC toxin family domain ribonuclease, partial [Rhodospirillales bacterium]|nr:VapC toxin family domain ribonuclease [Rhodospirillales bacterium]
LPRAHCTGRGSWRLDCRGGVPPPGGNGSRSLMCGGKKATERFHCARPVEADPHSGDGDINLIRRVPQEAVIVPLQVLGELSRLLVRKGGNSRSDAQDALLSWRDRFSGVESSPEVMPAAVDLATDHQLGTWDAVILSAASQAGCRLLLSEDLQEGFTGPE